MTRRRRSTLPVPVTPAHRRTWRSLWRRCSCGLAAPCVDRLAPAPARPYPPRPGKHRASAAGSAAPSRTDPAMTTSRPPTRSSVTTARSPTGSAHHDAVIPLPATEAAPTSAAHWTGATVPMPTVASTRTGSVRAPARRAAPAFADTPAIPLPTVVPAADCPPDTRTSRTPTPMPVADRAPAVPAAMSPYPLRPSVPRPAAPRPAAPAGTAPAAARDRAAPQGPAAARDQPAPQGPTAARVRAAQPAIHGLVEAGSPAVAQAQRSPEPTPFASPAPPRVPTYKPAEDCVQLPPHAPHPALAAVNLLPSVSHRTPSAAEAPRLAPKPPASTGEPALATRIGRPRRVDSEPALGLLTREAWLNDALRAAVEHAWRNWPVQILGTDLAEWRPHGVPTLMTNDAPLRVSAMGRGFGDLRSRTFGAGVGRAGSLTPAQRHRANGTGA
jgi:hypothetical protein